VLPRPAGDSPDASSGRWWKRGLAAIAVVAASATAFALFAEVRSPGEVGPRLTHTVTRGDLLVTVTEQGTLESSNNTEIKCRVRGDNTITWVVENGTEVTAGDELVQLDTLYIDEQINERAMHAHMARSSAARSAAAVAVARLAISEYLEGRFVTQLATLEKELAVAESRLRTARSMGDYATMMSKSDYVTRLDVEEKEFAVAQADLTVKLKKTEIEVLKNFTNPEEVARLKGDLKAAIAQHDADKARVFADEQRLKRAEEELGYCVVKAERDGMVIYPTAEAWKEAPEIEEGATVHKDQVLLLMPDLSQMQVKVGIHESIIEQIEPGLAATVTLPEKTLEGTVSSVSPVTRPAGWWTGNVVKYDTIVELPSAGGLKPGMTAEVEVVLAHHEDVLTIPASAVVESEKGYACWVETPEGPRRRALDLGDASDMFIVVESGLHEGEQVVLDPLACVEEAQDEAAQTLDETGPPESHESEIRSGRQHGE